MAPIRSSVGARLNKYVKPEIFSHAFISLVVLLTGHWVMAIVMAPLVAYNVKMYVVQLSAVTF